MNIFITYIDEQYWLFVLNTFKRYLIMNIPTNML